jgi:hypothetical protein
VREAQLQRAASRGAQRADDPATDRPSAKRDGLGAEAPTTRGSEDHGEAEAQEGQVDHWNASCGLVMQTDTRADQGPEDDKKKLTARS